ncbi:MAG: DUF502 domain-containing protein [Chloroflexota bacterium]
MGRRLLRRIRNHFLIGFALAIPAGITIWTLSWIFRAIDGLSQPVIRLITGRTIPGIGFAITILVLYLIGLVSSSVIGGKMIQIGEALINRVPLVRPLYTSAKEVVARFSKPGRTSPLQVGLVEYPRKGITSIAFITGEFSDKNGRKLLNLLIPTAPNPMSGFVIMVPEDEVTKTNIRPEIVMRMIVSCGTLLPQEVNHWLATGQPFPADNNRKLDSEKPRPA